MSSSARILCVCLLFCTESLVACGGSTDSRSQRAPEAVQADAGASNQHEDMEDKPPRPVPLPAAGAGGAPAGSVGGSTGGTAPIDVEMGSAGANSEPNPGPSGTMLSAIETDAQALALCNRIKSSISDADLKKMIQGTCAITGQTGAASQLGTCEELQVDCTAHTPVPSTDDGCTADDIPDCDNVTVDEYVACTRGTFAVGIQYLSAITCETDLESLAAPGKVSACAGPFARCPEYAAAFQ